MRFEHATKQISVFSYGGFETLSIEDKKFSAIIRIHNTSDLNYEEDTPPFFNELRLFFDDVRVVVARPVSLHIENMNEALHLEANNHPPNPR